MHSSAPHLQAQDASRLQNVDALRGFALLGILMVNSLAFADRYFATGMHHPLFSSAVDNAARFTEALLFEGKFYVLFSFLFGYSFSLQLASAQRAGANFKARMLRRSFGLLVLGVAHGCLLFHGDILSTYAVLSVVLLAWRDLPPRKAVRRGLWMLATGVLLMAGIGAVIAISGADVPVDQEEIAAKAAAFHGSAAATQAYIMREFPGTAGSVLFGMGPSALAMFLFGYAAGRERLLARVGEFRHLLPRVLWFGLPAGLAGALVFASINTFDPLGSAIVFATALSFLTSPLLTACYVALLLMLFETRLGGRVQAALAPMGKIALTNYLAQSAVMALLFTGYGLRWMDRVPPLGVMGIVFATFALQMAASAWWMRRHAYGPAEFALRWFTNWRGVRGLPAGASGD